MGILKVAVATSGGVASVATPTTFAVINHNKNVSITKDFAESVKKNEELTQENQEMNEYRVKVQALVAKESYEFRQEILELQQRLQEVEEQLQTRDLEKQTLEKKAAAMDQQNEKLKECANTFASMYVYGLDSVNPQIVWCSQQMQNLDLNNYLRHTQGKQHYSYPPHQ